MPTFDELEHARDEIARYILATADHARTDRLWPAHYMVFRTNPLSVAYGATGTAVFLRAVHGGLPPETEAWLRERRVRAAEYAPGLLVGSAGVAYALAEVGLEDRARTAMEACYASPLRFDDPTLFYGAAGWGLASLYLHRRTGDDAYLRRADEAAGHLLRTAMDEEGALGWTHAVDDAVHLGFGWGSSGIGLFLLEAGLALDRPGLVDAARRAVDFDVANRGEDRYGWTWPDVRGGPVSLPYWGHGSAGVGVAAVRLYQALGEDRWLRIAETIADAAFVKWSVLPSVVDGLAGIGEFMLDMHQATGRAEYQDRALEIADTVLWYAIEKPEGMAFPGRWLNRVSNDWATGSAGIGLFFDRILNPRPRFMVDLGAASAAANAGAAVPA